MCFDLMARDKQIDYSAHLSRLWFAGAMCSFEFYKVNGTGQLSI